MESMAASITDPTTMLRKPPVSHGLHGPEPIGLTMAAILEAAGFDPIPSTPNPGKAGNAVQGECGVQACVIASSYGGPP